MHLSHLSPADRDIDRWIRRAKRERDLADACAAHSDATGDTLAADEFTAEAAGWQSLIDDVEGVS